MRDLASKTKRTWNRKNSIKSRCSFSNGYLVPSDFVKIDADIFTHFTVNVPDTIRDSTLKFIFNNFKNLEQLHIRGSMEKCTNFGFIGKNKTDSINNLQGENVLVFALILVMF